MCCGENEDSLVSSQPFADGWDLVGLILPQKAAWHAGAGGLASAWSLLQHLLPF